MIQPTQPRRPDVPAIPVTAYVANTGSGTVTPIATATNAAGHPITVGSFPDAIATTPDGTTAYVANDNSGTVTPITTATNTAGTPITTGSYPDAIAIATTPPAASHEIKGYGGKCADDNGNSSAAGAKVQIWSCVNDVSQQWSFTGGELKHGSLCMNDRGNAGNGGHVILWSCNGASNEVWKHTSSGEYVLKSNGLCLDDPADSTRNGTQLDVYRCHNGSNQHWSLP
jgi:YVTN family beta-propeller protein